MTPPRTRPARIAHAIALLARRAEREAMERAERRLREHLWISHGHTALYGDDGEMQCPTCCADYLRDPIEGLTETATKAIQDQIAQLRADLADAQGVVRDGITEVGVVIAADAAGYAPPSGPLKRWGQRAAALLALPPAGSPVKKAPALLGCWEYPEDRRRCGKHNRFLAECREEG